MSRHGDSRDSSDSGRPQNGAGDYRVIGTRPIRHDGVDKVTGRAVYGADVKLPGLLHGHVLRSPHAHARIRSIDTGQAEALPGVKAVVTGADMPELRDTLIDLGEGEVNMRYAQDNVLASRKVLYRGHAVAAVAATSIHVARQAASLIEIDYEVLPHSSDVRGAMEADAPLLHDDLFTDELGARADRPSNVAKHFRFEKGDIETGFAAAEKVFEREFTTTMVHQGYIEPQSATALWNADGRLSIWCCTQGAFVVRTQTAAILDLPVSQVKVTPTEIGGGFGGKIPIYLEPVAALLSRKSGRPVKLSMDRDAVFQATGPTPGSYIRVKIGARKDGRIVAAEGYLAYEAGAYPGALVNCGMMCIFAPYDIDNIVLDGYDVVLNKPKTAPYRAPGATNAAMASETVIDEIAEWAGIDPLEIRRVNAATEGTRRADGLAYPRIGFLETVHAAMEQAHYREALEPASPGKFRGRGVASGFWFNCGFKSSVAVTVNNDGRVNLVEGSPDIGGTRTSIAMQLAEVLGIPAEDVIPQVVDTDSVGYTDVTGGSRVTFATGMAAIEAGRAVQREMSRRAAILWECESDDVEVDRGVYRRKSNPEQSIRFRELAAKLDQTGGPLAEKASVAPQGVGGGFATHIADVEVDPETGKVDVIRYTAVQDVGKAIHPAYVEGQIQGGVVQGIGWALYEGYQWNADGAMTNPTFLDYRMPTSLDLPMIDPVLVEVPNPGHPFGVRGVGEVPIVPPPAAIANAIHDAIGVRLCRLPMDSATVLGAVLEKEGVRPAAGTSA